MKGSKMAQKLKGNAECVAITDGWVHLHVVPDNAQNKSWSKLAVARGKILLEVADESPWTVGEVYSMTINTKP